jgi:thiol-disulfide isomerase/thioredoxin
MRCAATILALLSLIPLAKAQEPEHDPADPYWSSFKHVGVLHHEEMVGQSVPDVTFVGPDGKEIALSSYRGRPLLIDLWATWCAPCVAALPSLNRIYAEFKGKGMEFISLDQESEEGDRGDAVTAARYLAGHHYDWKNFHDSDRKVATALQCDGIPLVVLIDANGKIVYFDFGGKEAYLRKAIANLGPEFTPVTPSNKGKSGESPGSTDQN